MRVVDFDTASGHAPHPLTGRRAALATMHGKERAIAPPLERAVGLRLVVPPRLDTDSLGTFSGEIPRPGPMRETAIAKARLGMEAATLDLGLASEGSYGPHPDIPFVAAGVELLVLVDDRTGLIVTEQIMFEDSNYDHAVAASLDELGPFLDRVGFPSHGLIVRPNRRHPGEGLLFKGLTGEGNLARAIELCRSASPVGEAFIQSDMRAHVNPTRMQKLNDLAERLARRLGCLCPACEAPGFGRIDVEKGLPCAWCGGATFLVRRLVFGCAACDHGELRPRPDGLTKADPGHCVFCNP